jgi:hypothetical protein
MELKPHCTHTTRQYLNVFNKMEKLENFSFDNHNDDDDDDNHIITMVTI